MSIPKTLQLAGLVGVSLMTACGGLRLKEFEFEAINEARQPIPCMIVVNDQWPNVVEQATFVNLDPRRFPDAKQGKMSLDFTKRQTVTVHLVPLVNDVTLDKVGTDANGAPVMKTPTDPQSDYRCSENPRVIDYRDRPKALFVFSIPNN